MRFAFVIGADDVGLGIASSEVVIAGRALLDDPGVDSVGDGTLGEVSIWEVVVIAEGIMRGRGRTIGLL